MKNPLKILNIEKMCLPKWRQHGKSTILLYNNNNNSNGISMVCVLYEINHYGILFYVVAYLILL